MRLLQLFALLLCIGLSNAAHAAIYQHNFTGSGSNGETATGSFTWDSQDVPNGSPVANCGFGDCSINFTRSLTIDVSGGNVVGGTTTFTLGDCADPAGLMNAPDFLVDINFFQCDNGSNTLDGADPYLASLNEGQSYITWSPGNTIAPQANPIPASGNLSLVLLATAMALLGVLWIRKTMPG